MPETITGETTDQEVELTPSELAAKADLDSDRAAMLAAEQASDAAKTIETTAADTSAPAADEWKPNFKFKVLDEEKEIEEWARPIVTKDTEAKVRELFEKAYGLDHVKTQRDTERAAKTTYEQNFNQLAQELQEVGEFREKDLGMFFKKMGLTDQQVAEYVLNRAEALEAVEKLPPAVKTVYNQIDSLKAANHELSKKVEALSSGSETAAQQQLSASLASAMGAPEVDPLVKQYETRLGRPGAFKDLVIRHGNAEYIASRGQKVLSPQEAVREVIHILGLTPPTPSQGEVQVAQPKNKVVTAAKPTVLPNVGGGGATSTAKAPVSSLKELRERAKTMVG